MRTISSEELKDIISKHKKWLLDEDGGERANLRYTDLRSAELRYTDLRSAGLRSADFDKKYITIISSKLYDQYLNSGVIDKNDTQYVKDEFLPESVMTKLNDIFEQKGGKR
jgi:hypothetical protein